MKKLHQALFVTGQISLKDIDALADAGIKTIINNRPDHEEAGQLTQAQAKEKATQLGIDYVYLPMANGQAMAENLISEFKAVLDKTSEPVLAHCRSGMRSTFIWALGQVGAGAMSVDEVIEAAQSADIPLANYRSVLESAVET
ncbi:MAG: TIGR01244 family phosphatase [Acidiferrobacterales bacterium]|nr:TIGR01244 family phosphatase [Acidiferrobacterales bacterium]